MRPHDWLVIGMMLAAFTVMVGFFVAYFWRGMGAL